MRAAPHRPPRTPAKGAHPPSDTLASGDSGMTTCWFITWHPSLSALMVTVLDAYPSATAVIDEIDLRARETVVPP